uniref:Uncharacterized protein n=1 Tax=Knipowitschia caucasica TaxID=637954 RepID=A0AAV2KEV4_KNICA
MSEAVQPAIFWGLCVRRCPLETYGASPENIQIQAGRGQRDSPERRAQDWGESSAVRGKTRRALQPPVGLEPEPKHQKFTCLSAAEKTRNGF